MQQYIKQFFFGTTFRRNATLLSGGNILLLVFQTIFYPVVARLYTSAEFGEFAIVQSCTYILGFLMTLKYEAAILSCESTERAKEIKDAISAWSILLFFLLIVLILTFPSVHYEHIIHKKYALVIPVFLLSFAANQIFRYWFLRRDKVAVFMKYLFVQKFLSMISVFALAYFIDFYNGIILGHGLGAIAFLLLVILSEREGVSISFYRSYGIFKEYFHYFKFLMPSSVMHMGGTQAPFLITNEYFGKGTTGLLSMAMQVVHLPQTVLFSKISESLHQRFSGSSPDLLELRKYVVKVWQKMVLIMFLPSVALILLGEEIFGVILGDQWSLSGEMSTYLGVAMFTSAFAGVVYNVFIILNKQKILMSLQLFRFLIVLSVFIYAGVEMDILAGVRFFAVSIACYHILVCYVVMVLISAGDAKVKKMELPS